MLAEYFFVLLPELVFPVLLLLFVRALRPVVSCLRHGKRTEALSFGDLNFGRDTVVGGSTKVSRPQEELLSSWGSLFGEGSSPRSNPHKLHSILDCRSRAWQCR